MQRATMHTRRNMSDTEWARMVFVLQDCQPLKLAGQTGGVLGRRERVVNAERQQSMIESERAERQQERGNAHNRLQRLTK
jgi:hypothetical protein